MSGFQAKMLRERAADARKASQGSLVSINSASPELRGLRSPGLVGGGSPEPSGTTLRGLSSIKPMQTEQLSSFPSLVPNRNAAKQQTSPASVPIRLTPSPERPDVPAVTTMQKNLFKYVIGGKTTQVKHLLLQGVSPDYVDDSSGATPLMWASFDGHIDIVRALLSAGAKIDMCDKDGDTALIGAARHGKDDVVTVLVEHGADIHAKNKQWDDALMCAAMNNRYNVVVYLLDFAVDVTCLNILGFTAVAYAARGGHSRVLTKLLENGGDVVIDRNNVEGRTPFMWAARNGKIDTCKLLLEWGANPATVDVYGRTALDHARSERNTKVVKWLVDEVPGFRESSATPSTSAGFQLSPEAGKGTSAKELAEHKTLSEKPTHSPVPLADEGPRSVTIGTVEDVSPHKSLPPRTLTDSLPPLSGEVVSGAIAKLNSLEESNTQSPRKLRVLPTPRSMGGSKVGSRAQSRVASRAGSPVKEVIIDDDSVNVLKSPEIKRPKPKSRPASRPASPTLKYQITLTGSLAIEQADEPGVKGAAASQGIAKANAGAIQSEKA